MASHNFPPPLPNALTQQGVQQLNPNGQYIGPGSPATTAIYGGGYVTTNYVVGAGGGGGGYAGYAYPAAQVVWAGSMTPAYNPALDAYVVNTRVDFSEEEIARAEEIMEECDAARAT